MPELMQVNSCDQLVHIRASRKSRAFTHTYTQNMQSVHYAHCVLVQLVYALLDGMTAISI